MKSLINAIKTERNERLSESIKSINKAKNIATDLMGWQYNEIIPRGKKLDQMTLKEAKEYLIARKTKAVEKETQSEIDSIMRIAASGKLKSVWVQVEWTKSRTWGANPRAEAWASFINKYGQTDSIYIKGSSIGGCGYDKLSTAVAEVLNQIDPLLNKMYYLKNRNMGISNHELFGYGAGYGILPRLEGGVGVSCYPTIFKKIGFEFKCTARGKTFDAFVIEKT